ncbi:restriction endonuclease subunit S [Stutzerimonas nitrititolerans]|uniref:restriction endonuclease subunit S n=1 Tax=Stutzerimonas nitrititolerans TaxID=2482751 RepID=UPI0028A2A874|nr:restriction endonuclease subunit S [Stutzerimonas nitrititolerans]
MRRLKFSSCLINEKVDAQDSTLEYLSLEHIESCTGKRIADDTSTSEGITSKFSPNDVLFGKLRPYLAKVWLADGHGVATTEALVIRPDNEVIGSFLKYFMLSCDFIDVVNGSTYGSKMPRANWDFIGNLSMLIPAIEEQRQIAQFLDHKTAQIDRLIEKKQELIEKLQEQRITVITQAVTKGLDSGVALKDSGVEWLGDVPAHWDIWRLRFSVTMSGGMTPSTTAPQYWEGSIPWVTPKDMKSDRITSSIDTLTELALKETSLQLYTAGQVLIVVRGMILAHTFPVGVNDVNVTVNQDMKVLSTTLNSEYLAILLRGFQSVVLSIVEESAHGTKVLRTDLFKDIQLPVPPSHEQETIVAYIHRVIAKTDSRVEAVNTAIERLQEYRTALITAAVTGQIDVRDWQAPEPTKESAAHKEVA